MLVERRIRNRIFECVRSMAEYPRGRGISNLSDDLNDWEMNVEYPFLGSSYPAPAFDPSEAHEGE